MKKTTMVAFILATTMTIFANSSFAGEKINAWVSQNKSKIDEVSNQADGRASVLVAAQDLVNILNDEKKIGSNCIIEKAWMQYAVGYGYPMYPNSYNNNSYPPYPPYPYNGYPSSPQNGYSLPYPNPYAIDTQIRIVETVKGKKFYFTSVVPGGSNYSYGSSGTAVPTATEFQTNQNVVNSFSIMQPIQILAYPQNITGFKINVSVEKSQLVSGTFSGTFLRDVPSGSDPNTISCK